MKVLLSILLLFLVQIAMAQCNDYRKLLLNNLDLSLEETIEKYKDNNKYVFLTNENQPVYIFGNHYNSDKVSFKPKNYDCLEGYQDILSEVYYYKGKLLAIQLSFYFDIKDSSLVNSQYKNLISNSRIKKDFKITEELEGRNIIVHNSGKELAPKNIVTPTTNFYKDKSRKELLSIGYRFSDLHNEFEIFIQYSEKN